MSLKEQLYQQWLPALYRRRDAEVSGDPAGGPLRALLEIIGAEGERLDAETAQLLDNFFIETCEEWVMPYLGDLLGVRDLPAAEIAAFTPRAYVANTLRHRRRKGTAAMLEQLARDTTGWPAAAVEFFARLGTTQHFNHVRPANHRTPDLRRAGALELAGTPFEAAARSGEVRRIEPRRGRWNIPHVGLFLWRLRAYPVRAVPAHDHGGGRFSLSPLGHDAPLFHVPAAEEDITHLATELNVPAPIRRRAMFGNPAAYCGEGTAAPRDLFLVADGADVAPARIQVVNLEGWVRQPDAGHVAVDPLLGSVAFPAGEAPARLEFCAAHGFSADLGGGPYERDLFAAPAGATTYTVGGGGTHATLAAALAAWQADGRPDGVIEILDSAEYVEAGAGGAVNVAVPAGRTLVLRAGRDAKFREIRRPLLRLAGGLNVTGEAPADPDAPGGRFVLEGVLLATGSLTVADGDLGELIVRHATLTPGRDLAPDGSPVAAGAVMLAVAAGNPRLAIKIELAITGAGAVAPAPAFTGRDALVGAHGGPAIRADELTLEQATVLGRGDATVVVLASNSLFTGPLVAARRQEGCVRYSFLPDGSLVPRRHRCQPDHAVEQAAAAEERRLGRRLSDPELAALAAPIVARIRPLFSDRRFGQPAYAQLHARIAEEIFTGADDGNEQGAFHLLRQAQRLRFLRTALDEYLRAGLEAGVFTTT
ncbi:MAG TPA: hypothetical protein PKE47_03635 [Verrucomicrobiota bacterium]|nr:hypothetical protein [Verrucomicrobiota bacterium]